MGFPRCFFGRLNLEFDDRGYCPSSLRVCNRKQRRRRPPRSTPAIVDLPHPPDAAVAVASPVIVASAVASPVIVASAVAVAIAIAIAFASASSRPSKPPPFTNRILSFVKKACRFSRGSREGSAGVELVRESREGQAQGPQMHVQSSESSAEESREGLAGGELVREGIEGQGQEIHAQSLESSAEESREGLAGGELVREGIEGQGQEIHSQSSESSAEESKEGVDEGETIHRSEFESQFSELSVVVEESSIEESRKGVEEVEITHRPEIERQFTISLVAVEEVKTAHWPEIVQSPESAIVAEDSSAEESREGLSEGELVREGIEGQGQEIHAQSSESSAEESREGLAGGELVREGIEGQGQEIHAQSSESSAEESKDGVDKGETIHRSEFESQFSELSVVVEEYSIEESRKGVEEVEITHRPEIERQFTISLVAVEEVKTAHWPEIVQSPESVIVAADSSAEESREGLSEAELVREGIEGQGHVIHAQSSESSAEESREGEEQAEFTQGLEIARQFAKSSVGEEAEIGVQSPAIEAEDSSAEESRESGEEIEIVRGLETETQVAGVVEETETVHAPETDDQFTESSVVTEESSSEESREKMEEVDISHRPEIEAQFTELSVIVEEAKIGLGRGSKAQSLGPTIVPEVSLAEESREEVENTEFEYVEIDSTRNEVREGEIEGDTELEEGEIIDSLGAVMEESETDESTRAEVEDGEIIESSWNEVDKVPLAYCSSSAQANSILSYSSGFEKLGELSFSFACTEPVSESTTRHYRRNSSRRIAISSIPSANTHILSVGTDLETRQESQSSVIGDTAYESCKMWLKRGNEAYGKDHFSKAESFYTRAVNFAFEIHPWGRCIQALTLCHGNRAATRMYLGRMRDAIGDCEIALSIDPNFLRARVRMASCYLALGDIEAAMNNYNKCFQSQKDTSSERNRKILFEASDGLKKAQQVGDYMNQSMELLQKRTKTDAMKALESISEAMSISTHSESLLEIKAECLCVVGNYEEIIQICKHTLNAEKNSIIIGDSGSGNQIVSEDKLWRWRVLSMAYFYLGRLEQALELLQKHENLKPLADKFGSMFPKTSTSLSVVIRGLLDLKAAGNAAFHARKFSDAAGHYTAALALSVESRPFAAICLCSRAAAYQELGRVTDAISDCCFAITLDSRNLEAISKRATLYELVRDYDQATNDLKLLISILGNQIKDQCPIFDFSKGLSNRQSDLEQARRRLCTLEEKARKGTRTDMYMILGVTRGSSMTDVKNAYRRAALKHHPDKSGMLLITSENVNEGLWKEIAEQVHLDAERIFKLIGEAYDILSDASKRQKYEEEETRLMMKMSNAYVHRSNKGCEQSRNARYAHQNDPRTSNEGYEYGFNQNYEQSSNARYKQNEYTYGFKPEYEHNRNPEYAHRSGSRAGFNQGYKQSKNPEYAYRNPEYAYSQDYEHSKNAGYAHRSGPKAGFNQGYEQNRNTGYGHRSHPRAGNEERSYASNFHRRYPQFNYEDLDAQYDQQGQRWDHRWRDDRR